jgi:hypothetical protein
MDSLQNSGQLVYLEEPPTPIQKMQAFQANQEPKEETIQEDCGETC